jgi:phospholipid transport system substrate-binding protein
MKTILRFMAACLLTATFPVMAAEVAPDTLVKSTVGEVLSVIKQNKDTRALRELVEQKVLPHFDFTTMTRLAAGRFWREATPRQRLALEDGFRSLLVSTYTSALSQAETGVVDVKPLRPQSGRSDVTVKTLVKRPGSDPLPIDYRLENTPAGWQVYDVLIDNLSLITNYRDSFASEINRSGIDGLINALDKKNLALRKVDVGRPPLAGIPFRSDSRSVGRDSAQRVGIHRFAAHGPGHQIGDDACRSERQS